MQNMEDMKKATYVASCNFTKFYSTESNTDYVWLYSKTSLMKQLNKSLKKKVFEFIF